MAMDVPEFIALAMACGTVFAGTLSMTKDFQKIKVEMFSTFVWLVIMAVFTLVFSIPQVEDAEAAKQLLEEGGESIRA